MWNQISKTIFFDNRAFDIFKNYPPERIMKIVFSAQVISWSHAFPERPKMIDGLVQNLLRDVLTRSFYLSSYLIARFAPMVLESALF